MTKRVVNAICKYLALNLCLVGFAFGATSLFAAPLVVDNVTINMIRTGWGTDAFAIVPGSGQAVQNPAGCPSADGYISSKSDNLGYETHYSAALMAFAADKKVSVIVSDTLCSGNRPTILGIHVLR